MGFLISESENMQRIKIAISFCLFIFLIHIGPIMYYRNQIETIIAKIRYDKVCHKHINTGLYCRGEIFAINFVLKGPIKFYY